MSPFRRMRAQALKDENASCRRECSRLRTELNGYHSMKAEKMMDVAMEASTQMMEQEAEERRRRELETAVLVKELSLLERTWAQALMKATQAESGQGSWFPR